MAAEPHAFRSPDKRLAATCGLFCTSCSVFIASMDDPARLKALAERFNVSLQDMECHGCRSEKLGLYCRNYCKMKKCAAEKGIDFCGSCAEYPCADLKAFQAQMPHRIELWESQARIKAAGYEAWYADMTERYSCPSCGTINSAYDLACRKCAATPSCEYVKAHGKEVAKFVGRMGP